jgi:thiamine-phosphate pyrophosphorylase
MFSNNVNKIYLISPANIELNDFAKKLDNLLQDEIIGAFQLRLKNTSYLEVVHATKTLLPICKAHNVPYLINDFYQIARDHDIDGIHIGQSDIESAKLKQEFSNQKIIGVSCQNSINLAINAKENGADYVSFGSFFTTKTKQNTKQANLETLLEWKKNYKLPCAAIGGVNHNNIHQISSLKPEFICVISSIWNNPLDCKLALKQLKNSII